MNWKGEIQMNIVRKAMLHACWQDENERGLHAARPWLRLLLTGVVGIEHIPARESEGIQNGKKQWLAIRKEAGLRIDPETDEVMWNYRQTLDPYGIGLYIPEEFESIG